MDVCGLYLDRRDISKKKLIYHLVIVSLAFEIIVTFCDTKKNNLTSMCLYIIFNQRSIVSVD